MIQEVLHKLQELQEVLAQKYQIENELKEIPKALNTKVEMVNRLKQSYIDHNDRLKTGEKTLSELRIKMTDAERSREKFEEQMGSIATQREYEVLFKDIQTASEKNKVCGKNYSGKKNTSRSCSRPLQAKSHSSQIKQRSWRQSSRK